MADPNDTQPASGGQPQQGEVRPGPGEVTLMIRSMGDSSRAAEALFSVLHAELQRLAAMRLARERSGHTLDPGALVNEAFLRLMGGGSTPTFNDRRHFLSVAAEAMRRILVDHARKRRARPHQWKRDGGGVPVEELEGAWGDDDRIELVSEVLDGLAASQPRAAEVVRLRYFAGCSAEDVAELLGVSKRTVEYDWTFARAWIQRAIAQGRAEG